MSKDSGDIEVRTAREEDLDLIMTIIEDTFCTGDPLLKACRVPPREMAAFLRPLVEHLVGGGFSLVAVDKASPDAIVGILLVGCLSRGGPATSPDLQNEKNDPQIEVCRKFMEKCEGASSSSSVFSNPELEKAFELSILAVKDEYTGRKIGYKLLETSLEDARQTGCQMALIKATNFVSQHMGKKLGFDILNTFPFDTIGAEEEEEEDGACALDLDAAKPSDSLKIMGKIL